MGKTSKRKESSRVLRSNSDLSEESDLELPVARVNKWGKKDKKLSKEGKDD